MELSRPFDPRRVNTRQARVRLLDECPDIQGFRGYRTAAAAIWPFHVFDSVEELVAAVNGILSCMRRRGMVDRLSSMHWIVKPGNADES